VVTRVLQRNLPNNQIDFCFILLSLPEEMRKISNENLFLRHDNDINSNRILIFTKH